MRILNLFFLQVAEVNNKGMIFPIVNRHNRYII